MTTVLEYPDLEVWLAGYLRAGLSGWSARADRRWPASDAPVDGFDAVVRDDSGPDAQFTADRRVGVTVLGPEGQQRETGRCAERAAVLLRGAAEDPTTPVVLTETVRGPYAVDSGGRRPAYYLTAELRIVGSPITL